MFPAPTTQVPPWTWWHQSPACSWLVGDWGWVASSPHGHGHASPSLQVCEPLPSLPEVRSHAQVSLSLLNPAHRRLHEPQPYPVCPPLARHHWYTPGNPARPRWPEQNQHGSTVELQQCRDIGLQSPPGEHTLTTIPSCSCARWP